MKNNKFIIIVPFFNVENWIGRCIKSIKLQNYKNFECYLIDDLSIDKTVEIVEKEILDDERFHLIKNKSKKFALNNIHDAINSSGTEEQEIIVTIDGDDFLATKNVLSKLDETYNNYNCLMTYGSYMNFPSRERGNFCQEIPEEIVKFSSYRESLWFSSHLRTFKRSLWNKIEITDLKDGEDFYRMTWDMAFMFPMLEMAGPLAIHIPEILYAYNRENPINDDKVDHKLQLKTEKKIRLAKKYKQDFVSCNIRGPGPENCGLGNQLFCIANTISYAKDTNKTPFFPQVQTNKDIKTFKEIFYKNLGIGREIDIYSTKYSEPTFEYKKIPDINGNVFLDGYYQSSKYFEHNRSTIIKMLNIKKLKEIVSDKYGDFSDFTSIHIRRGDYIKLQNYHNLLDLEYYKKAISFFKPDEKFVVFSDDLEWCKKNLTFINNVLYFNCEEDWEDMILMSNCKNNIIANSTFSWWSAWFNMNENKKVYAPKNWFGPEYTNLTTEDLIPSSWRIL